MLKTTFWVGATSDLSFCEGYQKIAEKFGIASYSTSDQVEDRHKDRVKAWLEGHPLNTWLMVVDVLDFKSISERALPLLPSRGGGVLLTSKNQQILHDANVHPSAQFLVGNLDRDRSQSLVGEYLDYLTNEVSPDMENILNLLGTSLLIKWAAKYMLRHGVSVTKMYSELSTRMVDMVKLWDASFGGGPDRLQFPQIFLQCVLQNPSQSPLVEGSPQNWRKGFHLLVY